MGEQKVAVIPNLVVPGALGIKNYGILLTDQRAIFVLRSANSAGIAGALGGAVGAAIASIAQGQRQVDLFGTDPEALAQDEKNVVVPHAAVQRLRMRKRLASYSFLLEYAREDGKVKKIEGYVQPPSQQVAQGKAAGLKSKEVAAEYARKVQTAFQSALPATVSSRAEWEL